MTAAAISCLFRRLTGLYCPGCGGTRAFYAMAGGHPLLSFYYHPIIAYFVIAAGCGILLLITKKAAPRQILQTILSGAAVVLLVNYNLRNILLLLHMPLLP